MRRCRTQARLPKLPGVSTTYVRERTENVGATTDDNTAEDTDIEIVAAPAAIPDTIVDLDKESTVVPDR